MRRLVCLALLLVACSRPFQRSAPFKPGAFAIHLAHSAPAAGLQRATVAGSSDIVYLEPRAELTEAHLKKVRVDDGPSGDKVVVLQFNPDGAARMAQLTQANINQRLAIVVDGQVVMAPTIMSRVDGGVAMLTGGYTQEEAERLVKRLAGS